MRSVILAVALAAAFTCFLGAGALAQTPAAAGGILLLAAADDPRAAEVALKPALHDADRVVRLFAARVAAAGKHQALLPDLIAALGDEKDARPGVEMLRAALLRRGAGP